MEVDLFLPLLASDTATFAAYILALQHSGGPLVLTLHVQPSRVLWTTLRPLLFDSRHARRALRCILQQCFHWETPEHQPTHSRRSDGLATAHVEKFDGLGQRGDARRKRKGFAARHLKLHSYSEKSERSSTGNCIIWINPPENDRLESYFAGLLIRWEHWHIQAQSLSGYIATLGGGFFLCHHFQTAILLARHQQRMAVFLNDESLYYTCFVHQAYSHIYAGNFRTALSILRQVLHAIQPSPNVPPSDPVLMKMCLSARLFCKRMRQASRVAARIEVEVDADGPVSRTVDDHQRIRVVRDKSKFDDLVVPFTRASSR